MRLAKSRLSGPILIDIRLGAIFRQQARFTVGLGFEFVFFFAFLGQFFLAFLESVVGCGQDGSFNGCCPM